MLYLVRAKTVRRIIIYLDIIADSWYSVIMKNTAKILKGDNEILVRDMLGVIHGVYGFPKDYPGITIHPVICVFPARPPAPPYADPEKWSRAIQRLHLRAGRERGHFEDATKWPEYKAVEHLLSPFPKIRRHSSKHPRADYVRTSSISLLQLK